MANLLTCVSCNEEIETSTIKNNLYICPHCSFHLKLNSNSRIDMLSDLNSFIEWDYDIKWSNPLNDEFYRDKLKKTSEKYNLDEAIITGEIKIEGSRVAIGVMDSRYMMATMGQVVGEKVTRLFERATREKLPVIMFSCSGGARMQEGIISLMQMEKTSAAVKKHSDKALLYISVLTNPTMGGVTASFATLADIIIAEKDAMIGFAGRRVIEQNTGAKIPEGFQTAEFQLSHGLVDKVVSRDEMKEFIADIIKTHESENFKKDNISSITLQNENINTKNNAWEVVKKSRSLKRPTSLDYINCIFDNFIELHGDRMYADDPAIIGGIAMLNGKAVTVIGHQKGKKNIAEAIYRNRGMGSPSGYRKLLRLIKQGEKFNRPIIYFVDTIGASCGIEAEEQGIGHIIAKVLSESSSLNVPILSIIHGEGGSGGALALACGNEVRLLENATYSIITPEGYASILRKDNKKADKAADLIKMTSSDLFSLNVVEKVFREPNELDVTSMKDLCDNLKINIIDFIKKYQSLDEEFIRNHRYERFRKY